jgi:hypothetical protein
MPEYDRKLAHIFHIKKGYHVMIVLTFFIGKNLLTKQEMRIDNGAVSTGTISSKSAASRNKPSNKTTAFAEATVKKKKASTASMTTVATTTKKSRSGESVGHKEKDEMIKVCTTYSN